MHSWHKSYPRASLTTSTRLFSQSLHVLVSSLDYSFTCKFISYKCVLSSSRGFHGVLLHFYLSKIQPETVDNIIRFSKIPCTGSFNLCNWNIWSHKTVINRLYFPHFFLTQELFPRALRLLSVETETNLSVFWKLRWIHRPLIWEVSVHLETKMSVPLESKKYGCCTEPLLSVKCWLQ